MAGKFGKFLLFTTSVAAATAGALYYLQSQEEKKKVANADDDFDDFDGFDDEFVDDEPIVGGRKYTTLNTDAVAETVKKVAEDTKDIAVYAAGEVSAFAQTAFHEAKEAFQDVRENFAAKSDEMRSVQDEKVEEFFDDEDDDESEEPGSTVDVDETEEEGSDGDPLI